MGDEPHIGTDPGYWAGCPCAGCRAYRWQTPCRDLSTEDRVLALEERVFLLERRVKYRY